MSLIKNKLLEAEIRFGKDWESMPILKELTGFADTGKVSITETAVRSKVGILNYLNDWATADVAESPERWVVERDENNPLWEKFTKQMNVGNAYRFYSNTGIYDDNILSYPYCQYLTLEQWAGFFLKPESKVGDVGVFWDNDGDRKRVIDMLDGIQFNQPYPYISARDLPYKYFMPFPDELQESIKNFLKQLS